MYSILLVTAALYSTLVKASLVGTASSADFYPLFPVDGGTQTLRNATEGGCKKKCLNEGACVVDESGSQLCSCPPRFSGDHCQFEGEACGGGFCRHSSSCLELALDEEPFVEHMCDCTIAYTQDTYYAGEFCQYPSTQFCSGSDDPNGRQFCVNGGQCPRESHLPCVCPEGFLGPRCAFQIGVDESNYEQCDLPCRNGGTCQKGVDQTTKEKKVTGDFVNADFSQMLSPIPNLLSFEHCVCPPGFFGVHCEYQMEQCGNGEHLCFHGSTCISDGGEFSCDCSSSNIKTAGLFCEHVASSECEQWVDMTNGHRGFCTNGGHCKVDEYGSSSCTCPSGYMGEHCEFRVNIHDNPFQSTHQMKEQRVGIYLAFKVILITVVVVVGLPPVIFLIFRLFGQTNKETFKNTTDNSAVTLCNDGIIRDCNLGSKGRGDVKYHKEYDAGRGGGFSSVEIL